MPGSVAEVARALKPGGVFCICIVHPLMDGGAFDGDAPDAPYVLRHSYLGSRRFEVTDERDDLRMTFRGWSHQLEHYVTTLSTNGFVIDALREPPPATQEAHYVRWCRFPMFLHLRAIKRGPSGRAEKRATGVPGTGRRNPYGDLG